MPSRGLIHRKDSFIVCHISANIFQAGKKGQSHDILVSTWLELRTEQGQKKRLGILTCSE